MMYISQFLYQLTCHLIYDQMPKSIFHVNSNYRRSSSSKLSLGEVGSGAAKRGILGLDLDQKTVLPTRDPVYFDVGGSADC